MSENARHTFTATEDDHRIAKLAALAIGLHLIEAVLPSPLPGVKPGIANIVTLYVLYQYGIGTAAWVSLLRVFAGSLLLGQLFSPTFLLSFGGALGSLAILAAFAHISGQLLIVWLWLIPHSGIVYLTPVFALAALLFGLINGLVLSRLMKQT
jgi:heptaprenyl diphosphate synthase